MSQFPVKEWAALAQPARSNFLKKDSDRKVERWQKLERGTSASHAAIFRLPIWVGAQIAGPGISLKKKARK